MLSQALKLIWNRRRSNWLIIVEIAAAFAAAFVLLTMTVSYFSHFRRPLGFTYENVWAIELRATENAWDGAVQTVEDVLAALRGLPGVEAAHRIMITPFSSSSWSAEYGADAASLVVTPVNQATAEGLAALGVRLLEGRWFGPEDEGRPYMPVLVNRTFVERAFGPGVSPIGKNIYHDGGSSPEVRVVGVIEDFRQFGELAESVPYAIHTYAVDSPFLRVWLPGSVFIKVAPGTPAAFEERVFDTVKAIVPEEWDVQIMPWEERRRSLNARTLAPLKAGATLGAFLLLMVALGLIGVLWQDVVRRTEEIGLRRAVGAEARSIRRQILLETSTLAVLGIAAGSVLAVQFPLLGIIPQLRWAAALPGLVLASALILALVLASALYPSRLAALREPADALRYE